MTDGGINTHERRVPANEPLKLDDPNRVWQVRHGWIDVFAILPRHGELAGHRVHLLRARPTDYLFGVAPQPRGGTRLLALGTSESTVIAMDRNAFQVEAEARSEQPAALLDRWLWQLTSGATGGRLPPRDLTPLTADRPSQRLSGQVITPRRGVLWVTASHGRLCFLGDDRLRLGSSANLFPVAVPGWLTARDEVEVSGRRTEDVIGDERLWPALDQFHQLLIDDVTFRADEAAADERSRLVYRASHDRRIASLAWRGLESVTEDDIEPTQPDSDPLFAACQLVGSALGITVRPPLGALERVRLGETMSFNQSAWSILLNTESPDVVVDSHVETVNTIARASRFQVRRVRLEGDWWRRDNGPLLAFRDSDDRPLALIPKSPSRYETIDTTMGGRTPLTADEAKRLSGFAYQFYRPFPKRPLTPWSLFRFGLARTGGDWSRVAGLGLAAALVGLFMPIATGWIFEWIIPGGQRDYLLLLVLALVTTVTAGVLLRWARNIALLRAETRMDADLQAGLWDRLLDLPPRFFRSYTVGDMASRAAGLGSLRWLLVDVAVSAVLNGVFSLVYIALLFYYDVTLALLGILLFVTVLGATILAGFLELPYQRVAYQCRGRIDGIALQLITGLSRLRVAAAEHRAIAYWAREYQKLRTLEYRAGKIANALAAFSAAAPLVTSLMLFGTVALFPRDGLSLGAFLAFNVAFASLLSAGLSISSTVSTLIEIIPVYERSRPILEALPETDGSKTIPQDLRGEIEVSHVSFRYQPDSPWVLDNVSFRIEPGEFVAFVGPSGAGKSTLLRLLLGFESPTSGAIFFDREDLAELDLPSLRRQSGVVLQNARPLPGTVLDNIIGSGPWTEQDAWKAARLAGLSEDIRQMPQKMHTPLAERGSTLSGGQRQRLMIARAIATRPRLLFFDEATSAQDNETQSRVSRSLEQLNATRLVVAHRLSTIRHADRILVLDGGRIIEQGTYDDLIANRGVFAEMAKRQIA